MNNVAMGSARPGRGWDYYETLAGGIGAGPRGGGLSAVQSHMTNTLNTPIERLEMSYPLRIRRYALREDSGGAGLHRGGEGLIREYEFLEDTTVTLLTERRRHAPWGLHGGGNGACGVNRYASRILPSKTTFPASRGGILTLQTPGGGGWGRKID